MDSGLDSLGAVEFRSSLEAKMSLALPPTLVFDYPSVSAIVGYLETALTPATAAATESSADTSSGSAAPALTARGAGPLPASVAAGTYVQQLQQQNQVVAVVATYGRFPVPPAEDAAATGGSVYGPGGCVSLRDVITVVPDERYDVETRLTEDMPARFGGFIPGVQVR